MICEKCGANVNTGDNFCEECGASLRGSGKKAGMGEVVFPKSDSEVYNRNLAVVTNIGRRHAKNEDAGSVMKLPAGEDVLIVSDGVSSSHAATSASSMAIKVIKERLLKYDNSPRDMVESAIHAADEAIKALPYETREDGIYGPEATVVVAMVAGNRAQLGWVGDSRAYVITGEEQKPLTVDDSWIEMVVADGSMTREEASRDRLAHCVTQVLGMHDQDIVVHTTECELKKGRYFSSVPMDFGITSRMGMPCLKR